MKFSFHPEAETEFNEAIDYYEQVSEGLGFDFAREVYAAVQCSALPKSLASDWRRNQAVIATEVFVWDFVCGRKRRNNHYRRDATYIVIRIIGSIGVQI